MNDTCFIFTILYWLSVRSCWHCVEVVPSSPAYVLQCVIIRQGHTCKSDTWDWKNCHSECLCCFLWGLIALLCQQPIWKEGMLCCSFKGKWCLYSSPNQTLLPVFLPVGWILVCLKCSFHLLSSSSKCLFHPSFVVFVNICTHSLSLISMFAFSFSNIVFGYCCFPFFAERQSFSTSLNVLSIKGCPSFFGVF